jgi:F0F1-type ATP synthase assembly protein I
MGIGFWADERYETAPWLLLLGVVIGFGAFVLRIWRLRALVEAQSADAGGQTKR